VLDGFPFNHTIDTVTVPCVAATDGTVQLSNNDAIYDLTYPVAVNP
jgi:hypothetical protein